MLIVLLIMMAITIHYRFRYMRQNKLLFTIALEVYEKKIDLDCMQFEEVEDV